MIKIKDNEEIKKIIQEFFKKMSFEVEIKNVEIEEKVISVKIKTEEPKILIGQNGQTLNEIQHLLKAMLRRKISPKHPDKSGTTGQAEGFYLDIDVNDYKKKKIEYLKETARSLADEVALTKKEKILASMPAYERRIIHLELSEREDVKSESIGEEPERRVVIRPHQ